MFSVFKNILQIMHENDMNNYSHNPDQHVDLPLPQAFAILVTALVALGAPPICWVLSISVYLVLQIFAEGAKYEDAFRTS